MSPRRRRLRQTDVALLGAGPVLGAMPLLLARMRRDLGCSGQLRPSTAACMWSAYTAHAALTTTALTAPTTTAPLPPVLRAAALTVTGTGGALVLAGFRRFAGPGQLTGTTAGHLVTGGIYRYSRNPQYTGLLAALAGLAIARRSPTALALTAGLAGVYRAWVPTEEAHLVQHFGAPYQRYASSTSRWLGRAPGAAGPARVGAS